MSGTDQRPTPCNLHIVRGTDYSVTFTVTDSTGAAYVINTATIAADLLTSAGATADSFTAVVAGAGNNELTLSFNDTETGALIAQDRYRFVLDVTEGTDTRTWLTGWAYFYDRGGATGGNDEATILKGKGDLTLTGS